MLQGPYFDEETLSLIAMGSEPDAYALNSALKSFNLDLQPLVSVRDPDFKHHEQNAFLVFQRGRWFTLRRFGKHWMNLNDVNKRPCQILPVHLAISISHLQDDGCTTYVVRGSLPPCRADQTDFFDRLVLWNLKDDKASKESVAEEGLVWQEGTSADMTRLEGGGEEVIVHYPCESAECAMQGVCTCGALCDEEDLEEEEIAYEEAFEADLQIAIEMSVAEMDLAEGGGSSRQNKPLSIKAKSPPTSTVSSETVDAELGSLRLEAGDVEMTKDENQPQT